MLEPKGVPLRRDVEDPLVDLLSVHQSATLRVPSIRAEPGRPPVFC
jgi:hypothetical protein